MRSKIELSKDIIDNVLRSTSCLYNAGHIINGKVSKSPGVSVPWSNSSKVLTRRKAELFRKFLLLSGGFIYYDDCKTQWIFDNIDSYSEFEEEILDNYAVIGGITL